MIVPQKCRSSRVTRVGIISIMTMLGAAWLFYKGPMPVMRVTTPLPEIVPFWYMLSAFPALGILLADLASLYFRHGFDRRTFELAFQIGLLLSISHIRLSLGIPISGHMLLFAYVIFRRLCINYPPDKTVRWLEFIVVCVLYVITGYVKLVWWTDLITFSTGTIGALGLIGLSQFLLNRERHGW